MDYEQFFSDNIVKLDLCPNLFSNNVIATYDSEDDTTVKVQISMFLKATIQKNNLEDWLVEYPDLKDVLATISDFEPLKDGKVYPYLNINLRQNFYLYLYKDKIDEIIKNPRNFELDTSILQSVKFDNDCMIITKSLKHITKKKEKEIIKALGFPLNDYNEIYDLTVLIN